MQQNFTTSCSINAKPEEAIEKYVGDIYIQHNPRLGNGKAAFIEYFKRMAIDYPGKKVNIKKAIAEDNFVVLHCHQHSPGDKDYTGIHIFRFNENGKIGEHWDVLQVIPDNPANENTMF